MYNAKHVSQVKDALGYAGAPATTREITVATGLNAFEVSEAMAQLFAQGDVDPVVLEGSAHYSWELS